MTWSRRRFAIWACVLGAATLAVGIGVATGAKLKTKSETVSIDPYPDSVEREPDSESAIAA